MLTTDLALRLDPEYEKISRRFLEHPDEFALAFAKAWYKLLHRDMGPVERYLGPWVPEPQPWQDPVPPVEGELVSEADVAALKEAILATGLTVPQLVRTAWASASSFRGTDKRGGANGARIRLEPQRGWQSNDADEIDAVVSALEQVKSDFDGRGGASVSIADLIVLGGSAAVEKAAADAGHAVTVPFHPGRTDATQEQTDTDSFRVLQPRADGFRSYLPEGEKLSPETLLLDRANLLNLTAPEMTVLVGGMRAIGANAGDSDLGVLTAAPRPADQRLLPHPARAGHGVEVVGIPGERLRRHRPRDRRGAVDRHGGRPGLRLARAAAGARRRSTPATTRRRSSCATSWPPGSR